MYTFERYKLSDTYMAFNLYALYFNA